MAYRKRFVGGVEVFPIRVSTPSMSYQGLVTKDVMVSVHDFIVDKLFAKPVRKPGNPSGSKQKSARTGKRR